MLDKNQNILRDEYKEFLKTSGIKEIFVADKIGINRSTLYRWKKGIIKFGYNTYSKLDSFIIEHSIKEEKGDDENNKAE